MMHPHHVSTHNMPRGLLYYLHEYTASTARPIMQFLTTKPLDNSQFTRNGARELAQDMASHACCRDLAASVPRLEQPLEKLHRAAINELLWQMVERLDHSKNRSSNPGGMARLHRVLQGASVKACP